MKKAKKKSVKEIITKDWCFFDVLQRYPETMNIFLKRNMHCVGCAASRFETIDQGCAMHNLDPDKLVDELNKKIKKKCRTTKK